MRCLKRKLKRDEAKRKRRNAVRRLAIRVREGNLTMGELRRMMEKTNQLSGHQP
jgi:hypothetical protein